MILTFFACPKPFHGHAAIIQRNAITSWTKLHPRPRIVLFGDEAGTAELCSELSLEHVREIRRNEHGTPLFDGVLADGQARAADGVCCFINADIILLNDFTAAVSQLVRRKKSFLMIGQRTDLDVTAPLPFDDGAWPASLEIAARERGRLHGEDGIDYFVFTRGLFDPAPPLLVGRASIDNWLVFRARRRWCAVVDATLAVTAIHQNHDYSHHREGRFGVYHGDEAQTNFALAGGHDHLFWINDRTHRLTPHGLALDLTGAQLRRHWDRMPVLVPPGLRRLVRSMHGAQRKVGGVLRRLGLRKPLHVSSRHH